MLTIYLSSTYEDLKDYREAVIEALRKERHLVSDSYEASPNPVPEKCLQDVRNAQVYVGLFAWRYGWRPTEGGPSITEMEYREAVRSGKDCLVFLRPIQNWPAQYHDGAQGDIDSLQKITALRAELGKAHTPDQFLEPADLALKVTQAVRRLEEELAARIDAQKRERSAQLGDGVSLMAPLPPPHPRQLSNGLLLIGVRGADEAGVTRLAESLPKSWQVKPAFLAPESPDEIGAIDALALRSRVAALLLSPAGLQRLKSQPSGPLLLRLLRERLGSVYGVLDQVDGGDIPADWSIQATYPIGTWLKEGGGSVGGELANLCTGFPTLEPDLADSALIGLPWTLIAMTRAEAESLAANPQRIADELGKPAHDFFLSVTAKLGADWTARYQDRRADWQAFGEQSLWKTLEEAIRRLNMQPVASKRDHQAMLGNRIRPRGYPFDPVLLQEPAAMEAYRLMRAEGCLLIADELSLLHPDLNPDARTFLGDAAISVALISPLDPSVGPLNKLIDKRSPLNIGAILDRFDIKLDPCCEFGLNSPARLRRWLRLAIPETLAVGEARAADPDRRAEFRRMALGEGR